MSIHHPVGFNWHPDWKVLVYGNLLQLQQQKVQAISRIIILFNEFSMNSICFILLDGNIDSAPPKDSHVGLTSTPSRLVGNSIIPKKKMYVTSLKLTANAPENIWQIIRRSWILLGRFRLIFRGRDASSSG